MSCSLDACSTEVNGGDSQLDESQEESEEIITAPPKPAPDNVYGLTLSELFKLAGHTYDKDAVGAAGVTPAKIRKMCDEFGIKYYPEQKLFMPAESPVTVQRAGLHIGSNVGDTLDYLFAYHDEKSRVSDFAVRMDQLIRQIRDMREGNKAASGCRYHPYKCK